MEILTIFEAAQFLRLKEDTLRKWARENKIPAIKLSDEWRFDKAALTAWLNEQQNQAGKGQ